MTAPAPSWVEKFRAEAARGLRFGIVGVAATVIHTATAYAALALKAPILLANLIGFLTAFGFSFLGHSIWTFRLRTGRAQAAGRLFIVSFASFLFSTLVLAGAQSSGLLPPRISLLIAIAVIPLFNFVAARLWAFKPGVDSNV